MEPQYPTSAPGSVMPPAGEMPSPSGTPEPASWDEAQTPTAEAPEGDAPEAAEPQPVPEPTAALPQTPAPAAAPPPGSGPTPPTPSQQEIVQAAQHFLQVGQHVQQQLPTVQAQKQVLEQWLLPYAQNPSLVDGLSMEQRQIVQTQYAQWQQVAAHEARLTQAMKEVEQNAPVLQAMFQVEQQRAMLNRVGEPIAYQLLAERAKERSGDPNFPVAEMAAYLKDAPANALEWAAGKFEARHAKERKTVRVEQRVDDMGPGATQGGGGTPLYNRDPTELFQMDIDQAKRRR